MAAEGSLSVSTDTSRRNFRVCTLGIQTHVVAATTPIIDSRPLRRSIFHIYIEGDFLILELPVLKGDLRACVPDDRLIVCLNLPMQF